MGYSTVANDNPIDFIHIMFIHCIEWLFLRSVTVTGCWKLSDFLQCNNTAMSHDHLTFYEYHDFSWLNITDPATFYNFAV
jgi:hypothetical protein